MKGGSVGKVAIAEIACAQRLNRANASRAMPVPNQRGHSAAVEAALISHRKQKKIGALSNFANAVRLGVELGKLLMRSKFDVSDLKLEKLNSAKALSLVGELLCELRLLKILKMQSDICVASGPFINKLTRSKQ